MSAVGSKTSVQKAEHYREGFMDIIDFVLNLGGLGKFFLHLIMKISKATAKLKSLQ